MQNTVYALLKQSVVHYYLGQFDECEKAAIEAGSISNTNEWKFLESNSLMVLSSVALARLRVDSAEEKLRVAMEMLSSTGSPGVTRSFSQRMAEICFIKGDLEQAFDISIQSLEFAQKSDNRKMELDCYRLLSCIEEKRGDKKRVSEYRKMFTRKLKAFPEKTRERYLYDYERFDSIANSAASKAFVSSNSRTFQADAKELSQLREESGQYFCFADSVDKKLFIKGVEVRLFHKHKTAALFMLMAKEPGREVKPDEIFPVIWGRKFDPEKDDSLLRTAITRLRATLGESKRAEKNHHFWRIKRKLQL